MGSILDVLSGRPLLSLLRGQQYSAMSTQPWPSYDLRSLTPAKSIWALAQGVIISLCSDNPVIAGVIGLQAGILALVPIVNPSLAARMRNPVRARRLVYILGFCAPAIASGLYRYFWGSRKATVPSPLDTYVPGKSDWVLSRLPYPPDALPGARDVDTPHGKVRAYEWGPEDGRKVLLVHGISTPCISLAQLAENLAQKGCRVILFGMSVQDISLKHRTGSADHTRSLRTRLLGDT